MPEGAPADCLATGYARRLLRAFGHDGEVLFGRADPSALAWRRAGLMHVTGKPDGPGLVCPAALASAADGALMALKSLVSDPDALPRNGAGLLGERARLLGLSRNGRTSANQSCRLIATSDGAIALNLARPDDRDLMPILLDSADMVESWDAIERLAGRHSSDTLIDRGIEFGLPIARHGAMSPAASPCVASLRYTGRKPGMPLVIDLSALWAGPLAGSLLAMAGARVIKVESASRLDGARQGDVAFYDLLNGAKESVTLDFGDPQDRALLRRLIDRADIVIEGSRPRALHALGIDRADYIARGAIWVSITAHPCPDRVGFGDDAAVEAGLSALMEQAWGAPMFAGDAIADPLTGLHAALAAWSAWSSGQAGLVSLSLSGTVAHAVSAGIAGARELADWQAMADADIAPLYPLRKPGRTARAPGADNDAVFAEC